MTTSHISLAAATTHRLAGEIVLCLTSNQYPTIYAADRVSVQTYFLVQISLDGSSGQPYAVGHYRFSSCDIIGETIGEHLFDIATPIDNPSPELLLLVSGKLMEKGL